MGESTRDLDSSEGRSPWIGFVDAKNEEEAGAGLHARELSLLPATLNILLVLLFFFELVNGVLGFRLPLISEREK